MHSDTFFTIGTSHAICQDYALAGTTKQGKAYAVVADGCSSSAHTDFGARLLAAAAAERVQDLFCDPVSIICLAQALTPQCFPQKTILDSTLLLAQESEGGVTVDMYGDGFIIARRRDGTLVVISHDFNNAPPYLTYLLDKNRMCEYLKYTGGKYTRTVTDMIKGKLDYQHELPYTRELTSKDPTTEQFCNWAYYSHNFPLNQYDLVVLASDGLASFIDSEGKPVPIDIFVSEVTNVKTFAGEFMIRRAKRMLQHAREQGGQHYDDLGLAAIYLGDPLK